MDEIKCTPKELKDIITNSKLIGRGFFSKVFLYDGVLFKLDGSLYDLLKVNYKCFSDEVFEQRYHYDKTDFADLNHIKELAEKQKDITLTKLPKGIVKVNDRISGVILPYHKDYKDASLLSLKDYRDLLTVLKNLLLALKELAENRITQEDLYCDEYRDKPLRNVVYNNNFDTQIIDLDSSHFVKIGSKYIDSSKMADSFKNVIFGYYGLYNLENSKPKKEYKTIDDCVELLEEFSNALEGKLRK